MPPTVVSVCSNPIAPARRNASTRAAKELTITKSEEGSLKLRQANASVSVRVSLSPSTHLLLSVYTHISRSLGGYAVVVQHAHAALVAVLSARLLLHTRLNRSHHPRTRLFHLFSHSLTVEHLYTARREISMMSESEYVAM